MILEIRQIRKVVLALLVRELKTRFGIYKLGYIWAILEPLLTMAVFIGIRGMVAGSLKGGLEKFLYNIDYPLFLATGLLPFFLFRHSVSQLINAIPANKGLLAYQPIKPVDFFLARWVLEGLIFVFVWCIIFLLLYAFGFHFDIKDPLSLLLIYTLLYLFSLGIGIIFAIVVGLFKELRFLISTLLFVLFFVSCVFYSILQIPQKYQIFLLWNPLVHFIELGRMSFFELYRVEMCSYLYITFSTLISIFLGLSLYRLKIDEVVNKND